MGAGVVSGMRALALDRMQTRGCGMRHGRRSYAWTRRLSGHSGASPFEKTVVSYMLCRSYKLVVEITMKHNSCLSLIVVKRFFFLFPPTWKGRKSERRIQSAAKIVLHESSNFREKNSFMFHLFSWCSFFFCKIIFQKLNETHLNTLELRLLYGYTRAKYQAALDKRIDRG